MIEAASKTVHVYVVAEHLLVERYLAGLLREDHRVSVPLFNPLTRAPSCSRQPDVFILDTSISTPALAGRVRHLRIDFPSSRFLLVGPAISDKDLAGIMFIGMHGYTSYMGLTSKRLANDVIAVSRGKLALPVAAIQMYISASARILAEREQTNSAITAREREVAQLVVRRLSNKEIAASLGISESTVKFHLSRAFARLGVADRWALEQRIRSQEEAYESDLMKGPTH